MILVSGCGGTEVADPVLVYAKPRYVLGNTGYEERGTLFVAKADGSDPRLLTNGIYPDLSPNGRWVAFSRPGRRLLARYGGVASAAPAAADPVTGRVRPIGRFGAEAYTAAFSSDGRFVLVWDRGDLVRVTWDGAGRDVLVRNVDEVADWSL